MTGALEKLRARVKSGAKSLVDLDRGVLVMRVDLTDPRNRLRARDAEGDPIELADLDRRTLPELLAVLEANEPWRTRIVRQRYLEGMRGFVARHQGELVGYVLWVEGCDHPHRTVHSDLRWLGVRPLRGEIYTFDYYLLEAARGLGARFARTVQEAHHRMGYRAAFGCVFQANRAALWLYRTTGWIEARRVTEHRILSRIALVGRTLYWMRPFSRRPLLSV